MSEKAKEFFDNYDFSETINKDDLVISETDIIELMRSYADKHLKDVLKEAENEIEKEFKPREIEGYTIGQRSEDLQKKGAKWLLNHLKQRHLYTIWDRIW